MRGYLDTREKERQDRLDTRQKERADQLATMLNETVTRLVSNEARQRVVPVGRRGTDRRHGPL